MTELDPMRARAEALHLHGPDPTLLSPRATSNQLRSSLVRMSRSKRP